MSLTKLKTYLKARIPNAQLKATELPQVSEISLYLLDEDYPQHALSAEQAEQLMDNPPYWAFCWASGQVLARYILDNPYLVEGRQVVDFGAGSGVVAIAAAMSGADQSIACDNDLDALQISAANAKLNGVDIALCDDVNQVKIREDALIAIADVFYDRDNLPLLDSFNRDYQTVIVTDSRLKKRPLPGLELRDVVESHTVPDLNESSDFNFVSLYSSV